MSKRPDRPITVGPRVRWVPKAPTSDGDDAIFLASAYGLTPDPWQANIVRDWLGRKRNGKWACGRCGLAVPRQNGKNAVIEIRELFGMVALGEAILHTAHEVKTARKAFKRLKHFFGEKADDPSARFPELNDLVKEVRNTNGQEAIFLKDVLDADGRFVRRGGSIEFVARSKGSGRGFTVDVLILDEAQALSDDELEAIRSSVSSAPLGNAQVIYTGTPPNRDKGEEGAVWIRVRSRAHKDKRLCWHEYGAPDGPLPDIHDNALLYACNPALEVRHANGAYGLQMDVINDERGDLSAEGLARERFGWWGNPGAKRRGVIDMPTWFTLKVAAEPPTKAEVVVDVSPDLNMTSIALGCEGPDGRTLVLVNSLEGTGLAVQKVKNLTADLDEVVEVALTPTAHIFSAKLTRAGIEHKLLTNTEVGRGCTAFQESIRNRSIAHVGQTELDDAARNAITRFIGSDTQVWDRRDHSVDISCLVAGSVAAQRYALLTAKPKRKPPAPQRSSTATVKVRANDLSTIGF